MCSIVLIVLINYTMLGKKHNKNSENQIYQGALKCQRGKIASVKI